MMVRLPNLGRLSLGAPTMPTAVDRGGYPEGSEVNRQRRSLRSADQQCALCQEDIEGRAAGLDERALRRQRTQGGARDVDAPDAPNAVRVCQRGGHMMHRACYDQLRGFAEGRGQPRECPVCRESTGPPPAEPSSPSSPSSPGFSPVDPENFPDFPADDWEDVVPRGSPRSPWPGAPRPQMPGSPESPRDDMAYVDVRLNLEINTDGMEIEVTLGRESRLQVAGPRPLRYRLDMTRLRTWAGTLLDDLRRMSPDGTARSARGPGVDRIHVGHLDGGIGVTVRSAPWMRSALTEIAAHLREHPSESRQLGSDRYVLRIREFAAQVAHHFVRRLNAQERFVDVLRYEGPDGPSLEQREAPGRFLDSSGARYLPRHLNATYGLSLLSALPDRAHDIDDASVQFILQPSRLSVTVGRPPADADGSRLRRPADFRLDVAPLRELWRDALEDLRFTTMTGFADPDVLEGTFNVSETRGGDVLFELQDTTWLEEVLLMTGPARWIMDDDDAELDPSRALEALLQHEQTSVTIRRFGAAALVEIARQYGQSDRFDHVVHYPLFRGSRFTSVVPGRFDPTFPPEGDGSMVGGRYLLTLNNRRES